MTRSEKSIQNEGLVALSGEPESLYYRNNTGQAWQGELIPLLPGQFIKIEPKMVVLRNARPISFGLPGSADVQGVQQGSAVAVEFKTATGRKSDQQRLFAMAWRKAGGLYVLARSPQEAVEMVRAGLVQTSFKKYSTNC